MKWFTSDLHFGHKNIIHLQNRPFTSVEDMDEEIISYWNKTVKKDDIVYIIGDFSFYDYKKTKAIVERLVGRKILIRGNHDERFDTRTFINMGFWDVYNYSIIKIGGHRVVLNHYPYSQPWYKTLWKKLTRTYYPRWYGQFFLKDKGLNILHGHNHSAPSNFYITDKGATAINVAWDISNRFISEAEITRYLNDRLKKP